MCQSCSVSTAPVLKKLSEVFGQFSGRITCYMLADHSLQLSGIVVTDTDNLRLFRIVHDKCEIITGQNIILLWGGQSDFPVFFRFDLKSWHERVYPHLDFFLGLKYGKQWVIVCLQKFDYMGKGTIFSIFIGPKVQMMAVRKLIGDSTKSHCLFSPSMIVLDASVESVMSSI